MEAFYVSISMNEWSDIHFFYYVSSHKIQNQYNTGATTDNWSRMLLVPTTRARVEEREQEDDTEDRELDQHVFHINWKKMNDLMQRVKAIIDVYCEVRKKDLTDDATHKSTRAPLPCPNCTSDL